MMGGREFQLRKCFLPSSSFFFLVSFSHKRIFFFFLFPFGGCSSDPESGVEGRRGKEGEAKSRKGGREGRAVSLHKTP